MARFPTALILLAIIAAAALVGPARAEVAVDCNKCRSAANAQVGFITSSRELLQNSGKFKAAGRPIREGPHVINCSCSPRAGMRALDFFFNFPGQPAAAD